LTILACSCLAFLLNSWLARAWAQDGDHYYEGGLKVYFSKDSAKYFRLLTWHQMWGTASQDPAGDWRMTARMRRSRVMAYMQFTPRFMLVTHFGINNLTASQMDALGENARTQLFLHDAWGEYRVAGAALSLGAGLHYWSGLSRMTTASTITLMTLDNFRTAWSNIGTSAQFGRHLGMYAKGRAGPVRYHAHLSQPVRATSPRAHLRPDRARLDNANRWMSGAYAAYEFLDSESNFLPFHAGTYFGEKRVFNLGGGVNYTPGASRSIDAAASDLPAGDTVTQRHDHLHWAADAFLDLPLGSSGLVLNALAAYYHFDFGPAYELNSQVATGNKGYAHAGLLLPRFTKICRLMPYIVGHYHQHDRHKNPGNFYGLGTNILFSKHHFKLTLAYGSQLAPHTGPEPERQPYARLQMQVFI
jgi:hypothetical protein